MLSTSRLFIAFVVVALGTSPLLRAHAPATDMLNAATEFLAGLKPTQRQQATYPLTDAERENWNFVPLARHGLPFKQMTPDQHERALGLLRTGLSQAGMARADAIISMELVLKELENGAARRDPTLYYVTIFGTPAADKSWGWRFEGHHLSFNFTLIDGAHVFFAPSFIGSNPAEVRGGPRSGERVLGEEEDLGLALVNSLDDAQRKLAIFAAEAPREIFTTNKKRAESLEPKGISAAQLTPLQREKLVELVKLYLGRWRPELVEEAWARVAAAGVDQIHFAWAGALARGTAAYYRIQSPVFLVEFDNSQNNANHIHTSFRDFKGDFGHDALRAHYAHDHAK